ncbi:MAG: DEAD/DEAH box helicase [Rhodocyclaceae bacterium]|nr:DEAD/DEAH box helicase [Rhodocyclaceae bacterium]
MSFEALGLNPFILRALAESGYEAPTQVQQDAVPAALDGRDLLVSSRTGSGKTAAFMLPSLHRLSDVACGEVRGPRVLVLTPTRELAAQVSGAAKKYGRYVRDSRVVSVVGGVPYPAQNRMLAGRYEILVATPGRLIDQLDRGRIDFSRVEVLVLDEADRMLDMGFIEDIETVVAKLPTERQTLMFSATLDVRIARLARNMLRDPLAINIASQEAKPDIEQRLLLADGLGHKNRMLEHILRGTDVQQAIVFTSTKRGADLLASDLEQSGFLTAALHGDMRQSQRNRALDQLRRGRLRVLVATDVAARGIDVQGISHVINFDLPKSAEDYVHRIGRTGRAGRAGIAITLVENREYRQIKSIERYLRLEIPMHTLPGLEPKSRLERSVDERRPRPPRKWTGTRTAAPGGRPPSRSGEERHRGARPAAAGSKAGRW